MNPEAVTKISQHISAAKKDGRSHLTSNMAREILELAGIPFNKSHLATSEEEAVAMANEIGYPVVMKIVSPQVIHKTEVGGVKIGIETDEELRKAYNDIYLAVFEKFPDAEIKGISVDEMVKGTEIIIGTTVDPQFGHMIMFGIGGIFVEIYKDVSFRLVPISLGDARTMINEIKGRPLLDGARGMPKADENKLVELLMKVSDLVNIYPDIQEMDLNPLMVTPKGIMAVDARIIVNIPEEQRSKKKGIGKMVDEMKESDN